ncbi:MAG: DUF1989 domain-containing protein [Acidimicrobiia bacterium]|nr:DUF1989 domain-containing protein [Acidimicrobiia bacterium]
MNRVDPTDHPTVATAVAVPGEVAVDEVVPALASWSTVVPAGETLRMVDLHGNQAVDCLLYAAHDTTERYSAQATVVAQRNVYLTTGSPLVSNAGRSLMHITDDTCGRHDTIAGACSRESNTLRYGHHTIHQHACLDNFLHDHAQRGMTARDMASNINWFMNVPVEPDGSLGIVDGLSAPGKYVDLRADVDTLVVVSNCPQVNNPCNAFDPTPVRMIRFVAR